MTDQYDSHEVVIAVEVNNGYKMDSLKDSFNIFFEEMGRIYCKWIFEFKILHIKAQKIYNKNTYMCHLKYKYIRSDDTNDFVVQWIIGIRTELAKAISKQLNDFIGEYH